MSWDFATINHISDEVLTALGIVVLIVRQFVWRSADPKHMAQMPAIILGVGIAYLAVEWWDGFDWEPADWLIVAELLLVAATGSAMGYVTHFRVTGNRLHYRLTAAGIGLWAVFAAIRIGDFALADLWGANLAHATGLILLSFGVNRAAALAVVRRRARWLRVRGSQPAAAPDAATHAGGS